MEAMKYKVFVWPENPETFEISVIRSPQYTISELGDYKYAGLGPLCRVIRGSGVFRGEYAYENFNALQVLMANGVAGELVHPIWGTMSAFLTGLEMKSESRKGYVEYSFTFREADESGSIPALPEEKVG